LRVYQNAQEVEDKLLSARGWALTYQSRSEMEGNEAARDCGGASSKRWTMWMPWCDEPVRYKSRDWQAGPT